MKRFKFVFAALLAIAVLGGAFAFTSKTTLAPDTWFEFVGNPDNQASIETPSNYVQLSSAPANPNGTRDLKFIKVEYSTEVYASGTFIGKPIMDVSSTIQADVLNYTDIANGGTSPTEVLDRVLLKVE